MIRSSSSALSKTMRPLTKSSRTTSPDSGFLKRTTGVTFGTPSRTVATAAVVAWLAPRGLCGSRIASSSSRVQ